MTLSMYYSHAVKSQYAEREWVHTGESSFTTETGLWIFPSLVTATAFGVAQALRVGLS